MENDFTTSNEYITILPPVYLMQAQDVCYYCGEKIDVFCLAASEYIERQYLIYEDTGEYQTLKEKHSKFVRFSNVKHATKNILTALEKKAPYYRLAYTKGRESFYYVNHCSKCGAKQGDYYLHDEPDGAFFPSSFEKIENVQIYQLAITDTSNIVADLNIIDHDYLKKLHIAEYSYIENSNSEKKDTFINFPHDRYFRSMLSNKNVAKDFLEWHLPDFIKEKVDLDTIEAKKDSFVDENFKKLETDILFSVNFDDKPGYIYSLVEAQKQPQRMMPLRIFKYLIAIMEKHRKETGDKQIPIIYPIILYQGEKLWNHSTNFFNLFSEPELSKQILTNDIQLVDIQRTPDSKFSEHFWAGIFEACIKWGAKRDIINTLEVLMPDLIKVEKLDRGVLLATLTYLGNVGDTSVNDIINWGKNLGSSVGDEVVALVQRAEKVGEDRGFDKGVEKGIEQGEETLILNMLREGYSDDEVSKISKKPKEQIQQIKAKNQDKF